MKSGEKSETQRISAREMAQMIEDRLRETCSNLHEGLEQLRGPVQEPAGEPLGSGEDLLSALGRIGDLATEASLRSGELSRVLGDAIPPVWECGAVGAVGACDDAPPMPTKKPGTRRR